MARGASRPRASRPERGIAPGLLIEQVRNTMPYVFEAPGEGLAREFPPARWIREWKDSPAEELKPWEYFRLCLSAHYLTCATPVPTDVDNAIRLKLWKGQEEEVLLAQADLVLKSRSWPFEQVSARCLTGAPGSAWAHEVLSGHLGEWFTVAAGAYSALRGEQSTEAARWREALLDAIRSEVARHGEIFASLWRAGLGREALLASANLAHNLGDLDRVIDQWGLEPADPLRMECYQLGVKPWGSEGKLRHLGRLWTAGELYKSGIDGSSMAHENHRHFALRKPRVLRSRPEFRVPLGPFFDPWAESLARGLAPEELTEVAEALLQGWLRMKHTWSYLRALRVLREAGAQADWKECEREASARVAFREGREVFERRWNEAALRHLDEIPGRA